MDAGAYSAICEKLNERLLVATTSSKVGFSDRHVTDAEEHQRLLAYGRPSTRASLVEERETFEKALVEMQKPVTVCDDLPRTLALATAASAATWDDRHVTQREQQIKSQEGNYDRRGTRAALAAERSAYEKRQRDSATGAIVATEADDLKGRLSRPTMSSSKSSWAARKRLAGTGSDLLSLAGDLNDDDDDDDDMFASQFNVGGLHEGGLTQMEFEEDFNTQMRRRTSEVRDTFVFMNHCCLVSAFRNMTNKENYTIFRQFFEKF